MENYLQLFKYLAKIQKKDVQNFLHRTPQLLLRQIKEN